MEGQVAVHRRLLFRGGGGAEIRYYALLRVCWAFALPWPLLLSLGRGRVLWWTTPRLRRRLEQVPFEETKWTTFRERLIDQK